MKRFSLREKRRCLRVYASIAGTFLVMTVSSPLYPGPASAEIPPLAEKKTVTLDAVRCENEQTFTTVCSTCHAAPNPVAPAAPKPGCSKDLSAQDRARVHTYLDEVTKGKGLYESRCGRCHKLVPPAAHTREYWSKNVCTSGECFIENLNAEQEQQVLLYLSSQAKREELTRHAAAKCGCRSERSEIQ